MRRIEMWFCLVFVIALLSPAWTQAGCIEGDCINGEGAIEYPDGSVYRGTFEDGRAAGRGTLEAPDGTRYTGGFRDNEAHGTGVMVQPDGTRYEGGFRNNVKHGLCFLDSATSEIYSPTHSLSLLDALL